MSFARDGGWPTVTRMRLVLDTNVFVAAIRSPSGASAELFRRVQERRLTMVASVPLFVEYEAVGLRPEHLRAAGASARDIRMVLDALAPLVEPAAIAYLWRPTLRDPNDDMVLEAAINGRADAIVTFNGADFGSAPSSFGIGLARANDILRGLRWTP